jgi:predicted DNA-binding transcriptional regulator AlpA
MNIATCMPAPVVIGFQRSLIASDRLQARSAEAPLKAAHIRYETPDKQAGLAWKTRPARSRKAEPSPNTLKHRDESQRAQVMLYARVTPLSPLVERDGVRAMARFRDKIVRIRGVLNWTGLDRAQLHELTQKGCFPRPMQLDGGDLAWRHSAINAWLAWRESETARMIAVQRSAVQS